MTPRKFKAQVEVHAHVVATQSRTDPVKAAAAPMGYIDQIPGW